MQKIIHIDMDAFFASVEQRDHEEFRNKPLIIGGSPDRRGVVSTCSYEARKFGVHSAMSTKVAQKLCPNGIFIEGDMKKYRKASQDVFKIFHKYTPLVEPMSIDEAFLDVTDYLSIDESATSVAKKILAEIYQNVGLTASAGVSYNKFLAKSASGLKKPAGLTIIRPDQAENFLNNLPIEQFYGIGKVSAKKLISMNIKYGRDLKILELSTLLSLFGKNGKFFYDIVRGIDLRKVETTQSRKSYGKETTFDKDTTNLQQMRIVIKRLAIKIAKSLQKDKLYAKTVTLKLKYSDFKTITRSYTLDNPSFNDELIAQIAIMLLDKTQAGKKEIRLIGVSCSNVYDIEHFKSSQKKFEQLLLPFID